MRTILLTTTAMMMAIWIPNAASAAAPPGGATPAAAAAPKAMRLGLGGTEIPVTAPGKLQPRSIEINPVTGKQTPITAPGKLQPRVAPGAARGPVLSPIHDGVLGSPGAVLGGKTFDLSATKPLVFEVPVNQINGLNGFTPSGNGVTVKSELVKAMVPGQDGDQNVYRFTVTPSPDAKPGTEITLTSKPDYMARNDKNWAFSFKVKVQ